MKTMKTMKITGGRAGYRRAVLSAYYGDGKHMHNPSVVWSADEGFVVESELLGRNPGEVLVHVANFSANTGNTTEPGWADVRERIMAEFPA